MEIVRCCGEWPIRSESVPRRFCLRHLLAISYRGRATIEGKTLGQTQLLYNSRFLLSFVNNLCHSLRNGRRSSQVRISPQISISQLTIAFSFPPVRACLFDMDGLLIDSEDLYTHITNKILHSFGKPSLPWSIKAQLQGRPQPEVHSPLSIPTHSSLPRPRPWKGTHRILT